ncbi:uncharacterized protein LOC143064890 isoform X1 [Mytilus galloprovincialis]|uniref:uncharacterized protein LOC143064890 isoform X1 n=1 Tax=Mytilus galloprovincialis TaxID=29158 RepID=UPI003F7CC3D8
MLQRILSIAIVLCLLSFTSDAASTNQITVVPAVLGSSVTLQCHIREAQGLLWDHVMMHGKQKIIALRGNITLPVTNSLNNTKFFIQVNSNSQSLIIQSLTLQDDGTYRCYDVNAIQKKESFKVNILVKPTLIKLHPLPAGGIDEGSNPKLTCEADGGKPPPIFEWYITGPSLNITSLASANSDTTYSNGTGLRTSQVVLTVDRSMYKATVLCKTEITYFFVVQNNVSLNVNLFPGVPIFRGFNGIFDDGQTQTITCESTGSRPAANITWYMDGRKQNNPNTHTYQNPDGTFFVTSSISKRFDKSMDGVNLTCKAMNVVLQRQHRLPVETTVILRAAYMPVIHASNGTLDVYEHNQAILQCYIDARPMSSENQVFWLKNGQMVVKDQRINTNYSIKNGQFDLHIREVKRDDIGQYQCQASNRLGIARSSPPLHLNVFYRPVCMTSSIEKLAASIGQTVTLTCRVSANPATNVTIIWRYKTRNTIIKDQQPSYTDPYVAKTATNSIQIKLQGNIDYTDIECIAKNDVGSMIQPCLYMIVKPGPPDIPKSCNITLEGKDELDIKCMPGFSGGGDQYFILQRIQGLTFISVKNNNLEPTFNVSDLVPGQNYTYRVCAASVTYTGTVSCSYSLSIQTPNGNSEIMNETVAASSPQDNTLYIVGGTLGFLFLLLLTAIIVLCIVKRRQQSTGEQNVRGSHTDVSRRPRDNSHFHLAHETDEKHENILPAKLEDEHSHKHEESHHSHSHKADNYNETDHFDGQVTALHSLTLKSMATTNHDKPVKSKDHGYMNTNYHRGDEIDLEDIYAVSTKHKSYAEQDQCNNAFKHEQITCLDDSIRSKSMLTLSSASSRNDICYSESDITKALDRSGNHDLSTVTKSLRRSSSLCRLDSESENRKEEKDQISNRLLYYDKDKRLSGTDAYVFLFPRTTEQSKSEILSDEPFVRTRRSTYKIDTDENGEDKNLNRRRSYSRAILDDERDSKNVGQTEDEVLAQSGLEWEEVSSDISTNEGYNNPIYDEIKEYQNKSERLTENETDHQNKFFKPSSGDTRNTFVSKADFNFEKNNINNNYNPKDEKLLKNKQLNGIIDNDESASQDVVAYF